MFYINRDLSTSIPDIKCCNPEDVRAALIAEGISTKLLDKANSFTVRHGTEPNIGYFLITKKDFDALNPRIIRNSPTYRVLIKGLDPAEGEEVTDPPVLYTQLTLTHASCILGSPNDENSICLIRLEDIRWWLKKLPCSDNTNGSSSNNLDRNMLSIINDFNTDFFKSNTVKSANVPYTLSEILDFMVEQADEMLVLSGINLLYDADDTFEEVLYNVEFTDVTVSQAFHKLCEAARLTYIVQPTLISAPVGESITLKFLSKSAEWPNTSEVYYETTDLGSVYRPEPRYYGYMQRYSNVYEDDACNDESQEPNMFVYNIFSLNFINQDNRLNTINYSNQINLPHLFELDFTSLKSTDTALKNTLEDYRDTAAENILNRYNLIYSSIPREAYWYGYKNIHNLIGFGLEEVIYADYGRGFTTIGIGKGIDNMFCNYTTPAFPVLRSYKPSNLYRFTNSAGNYTIHSIPESGVSANVVQTNASVIDPAGVFSGSTVTTGYCIRQCDYYILIQAACP